MNSKLDRWQLQDAKAQFSSVVDAALKGRPQCVSRHGKDAVVVISYETFCKAAERQGSLLEFFQSSPLAKTNVNFSRQRDSSRDIEL